MFAMQYSHRLPSDYDMQVYEELYSGAPGLEQLP